MLKNKMMFVTVLSLVSIAAFADDNQDRPDSVKFSYECKFDSPAIAVKGAKEGLQCWVEGNDRLSSPGVDVTKDPRRDEQLKIRCNSGFELRTDDPALAIKDGALWINGDRGDKIATLRVKDFIPDHAALNDNHHDYTKYADLLLGDAEASSAKLRGSCSFRFDHSNL